MTSRFFSYRHQPHDIDLATALRPRGRKVAHRSKRPRECKSLTSALGLRSAVATSDERLRARPDSAAPEVGAAVTSLHAVCWQAPHERTFGPHSMRIERSLLARALERSLDRALDRCHLRKHAGGGGLAKLEQNAHETVSDTARCTHNAFPGSLLAGSCVFTTVNAVLRLNRSPNRLDRFRVHAVVKALDKHTRKSAGKTCTQSSAKPAEGARKRHSRS
jgi:hypothetical protein